MVRLIYSIFDEPGITRHGGSIYGEDIVGYLAGFGDFQFSMWLKAFSHRSPTFRKIFALALSRSRTEILQKPLSQIQRSHFSNISL